MSAVKATARDLQRCADLVHLRHIICRFLFGGSIIALHQALRIVEPTAALYPRSLVMIRLNVCDLCDRTSPCCCLVHAHTFCSNLGWVVCSQCRWKAEHARSRTLRARSIIIAPLFLTVPAPSPPIVSFYRHRTRRIERAYILCHGGACGRFIARDQEATLTCAFGDGRQGSSPGALPIVHACALQRGVSVANLARHNRVTMLPLLRHLCSAIQCNASIDPLTSARWRRCIRCNYFNGVSFLVARGELGSRLDDNTLGVVESFLCTYLL